MKDKREPSMASVIESLEKTRHDMIDQHQRDIAALDRTIENFRKLQEGKGEEKSDGKKNARIKNGNGNGHAVGVHAQGSWQQVGLTDAIHVFLSNFDGPVPFETLMTALQDRGVRLGDPEKPQRYIANLKTAIVNNRKRFHYDKKKDTVALVRAASA